MQNLFEKSSLFFEKGKLIATVFFSPKNHLGIISSSSTLLKLLMVFPITLCRKPVFKNYALILAVSDWKLEQIFLALCNSPLIVFFLYQNGTFEGQSTGYIDFLSKTWVFIWLLSLIIWVSKISYVISKQD